jgi:hypothetical protein
MARMVRLRAGLTRQRVRPRVSSITGKRRILDSRRERGSEAGCLGRLK